MTAAALISAVGLTATAVELDATTRPGTAQANGTTSGFQAQSPSGPGAVLATSTTPHVGTVPTTT
ncbi:MAG: hypothetical protein IVW52_08635 [Acidimicrobiales bacterium]|nr:hypothetical protein [Acidimicrobiales bacterium]